jgi:hypothetical protein
MSYMMAKSSYLTDNGGHNGPHLMFYAPTKNIAAWVRISPIPLLCR